MSFSSLLSQIKNKQPQKEKPNPSHAFSTKPPSDGSKRPDAVEVLKHTRMQRPVVDPAVERLKELRRLEKEKEQLSKKQTTIAKPKARRARPPSHAPSHSMPTNSRQTSERSNTSRLSRTQSISERSRSPIKRLSFTELMSQAQKKSNDLQNSQESSPPIAEVKHQYISKTQPRDQVRATSTIAPSRISRTQSSSRPQKTQASALASKLTSKPPPRPVPKPVAQPSAKLREKLEQKKRKQDLDRKRRKEFSDDEYESDFVVDEEAEDVDSGYDRDEIWRIFNKGRARSSYNYYDEDISDMEASGNEILKEEIRAAKRARLEDLKEQELERKRAEEKRKLFGKK